VDKKFPSRFFSAETILMALEGYHIGVYTPGSTPKILYTSGKHEQDPASRDAVPVPIIFIRRSSSAKEKGPVYYVYSGEKACIEALKSCHFRIKSTEAIPLEMKPVCLDASNIACLVDKLLNTHFFVPIPYLMAREVDKVAELFSESIFSSKSSRLCLKTISGVATTH
jgi:hypothetical protein